MIRSMVMVEEKRVLGRPPLKAREGSETPVKRSNVYLKDINLEGVRILMALTNREKSDLINEAIELLLKKYQNIISQIDSKRYGF